MKLYCNPLQSSLYLRAFATVVDSIPRMLLDDGRLGLIDFGLVAQMTDIHQDWLSLMGSGNNRSKSAMEKTLRRDVFICMSVLLVHHECLATCAVGTGRGEYGLSNLEPSGRGLSSTSARC